MRGAAATLVGVCACGPQSASMHASEGDGSTAEEPTAGSTSSASSATSTSGPADDTTRTPDTDDPASNFLTLDDLGAVCLKCSVLVQDCPTGEKCTPWANDGSTQPNTSRCAPIAPDPALPGEPCTIEGAIASGLDDCELGSFCYHADPQTLQGECVSLCEGPGEAPSCPTGIDVCVVANDGALWMCLPPCHPLGADCGDDEACLSFYGTFACTRSQSDTPALSACELPFGCAPGLACLGGDIVPGCTGDRCCSPYCDLADPLAAETCAAIDPALTCVPWFHDGEPRVGLETLGVCALTAD